MKNSVPPKLFSTSLQSATKRIFDCLIDVEDVAYMRKLVRNFIVEACLPRSLLLRLLRLLLIYLDRGYKVYEIYENIGESAKTRGSVADGDVNDLGRRQRSVEIMREVIHCVISRWGDRPLLPQNFLQDDGVSPRTLSVRGRQAVVMYMVESFVRWSDVMSSSEIQCCKSCATKEKWPNPPKILDLRVEHGNWNGTRIALAAISSIIKSDTWTEIDSGCIRCHKNDKPVYPYASSTHVKSGNFQRSVINLNVVLFGAMQDWVVGVLIFVLLNSSSKGFDVEISSIRSEDIDLYKLTEILKSLRMPEKVQSLELRMKEPRSILKASPVLRTLTGLQSFTFAHLWRQSTQNTEFTTNESICLKNEIMQHWEELNKFKLEGIVLFSDFSCDGTSSIQSNISTFLNSSIEYLEFTYESLSEQTLEWLIYCEKFKPQLAINNTDELEKPKKYPRISNNSKIHTLRFVNECLLTKNTHCFTTFLALLQLMRNSLKTFTIDHCGLNEEQAKNLLSQFILNNSDRSTQDTRSSSINKLPLEHFTFRETEVSASVTSEIFDTLCEATHNRVLPNFTYFGVLTPKRSDVFWRGRSSQKASLENWTCPFEIAMNKIAKEHNCQQVSCDIFWEPCGDDAM